MSKRAPTVASRFFEFLRDNATKYGYDETLQITDKHVNFDDFSKACPDIPKTKIFTQNGLSWARTGIKAFDSIVYETKRGIRPDGTRGTISIKLNGKKRAASRRAIKPEIVEQLRDAKCIVLDCTPSDKCEVDHKNGRYDEDALNDVSTQQLAEFQPLHPTVNKAKREHCKKCKNSGRRFDAKVLGYCKGWTHGDAVYRGTCIGCYWYDPKSFNATISKSACTDTPASSIN